MRLRRSNVKWFSTRKKGKRKSRRSPMQLVGLRLNDLARLIRGRYGVVLPDDDAGRDDMMVALHHLVRLRGHVGQAERWCGLWAPWLSMAERDRIIADVRDKPQVWTADDLAARLRLTKDERSKLGITTIGAIDQTSDERAAARRERDRLRKERIRRAQGSQPRKAYLDETRESQQPWALEGVSRATWYRRNSISETSPATALKYYCCRRTCLKSEAQEARSMTTTFAEPPISYDGSKWFLIVASPRCEVSAQLQLYAKGHRTFLPKLRKWVTHARVKKAVERPILGRYLFVEVDYPRQSFAQVSNTRGVEYIVANNGIPVVVEARWVEDLMCRQLQGEWDETAKSEIPLGARVRILEGQFENLLATIIAVKGNQMFAKILGAVTVAKLHKSSIQPA